MRNIILSSVLIAVLLSPAVCLSQNPWNMEVIGRAAHDGYFSNYTAYGDYMYFITKKNNPNRYLLTVVDISNPSHPHRIRELSEGEIRYGLLLVDSLLYVISSETDSIIIYSLGDPSYPQELIRVGIGESMWQLERLDENLIGSPGSYSYDIIDIQDRFNPRVLMTLNLQYFAINSLLIGDYLYIAGVTTPGFYRYLEVFDISDTLNPSSVYFADMGMGYFPEIQPVGSYLYFMSIIEGTELFDISNPANPVLIDTVLTDFIIREMQISGNYAYGIGYFDSLLTIDVSNPISPVIISGHNNKGWSSRLSLVDEKLFFVIKGDVINLFDNSNPSNPVLEGRYILGTIGRDVAKWGNYVYLAKNWGGFRIFDVSDPTDPVGVGFYDTDEQTHKIHISNGLLFISDNYSGVLVFSLADPANPVLLSTVFIERNVYDMYASDTLLYFTYDNGFKIANIADPTQPVIIGQYFLGIYNNNFRALIEYGDYVYTSEADRGLCVYYVADPTNPIWIHSVGAEYAPSEFVVRDTLLYVADHSLGLLIFDISVSSYPVLLSSTPPGARSVGLSENEAYLAYTDEGVKVFDITDLSAPELVGTYEGYGFCNGIVVENDTAYVSAGNGGLWILRYESPTDILDNRTIIPDFGFLNNYPNPFNAQTTIEFTLPEEAEVELAVYDLLGRKAATLIEGVKPAGVHSIIWDADDVPSGIYFARLEAQDKVRNIKMVLLK